MAAAENPCASSTHTETTAGLYSQAEPDEFLYNFLCDYLASHDEGRDLVEIIEDRFGLHLKDLDRISAIYCDFKEAKGKTLNRDLKSRKDNFKNILKLKITKNWIERFGNGTEDGKEYLKYEVKNHELWQSLTRSYSVVKNLHMLHGNFLDANSQLSAEPSSDEGGSYSHSHVLEATTNSTHGNYGTVVQNNTTSPRLNDPPDSENIFSCLEGLPPSDMEVMEHFDQPPDSENIVSYLEGLPPSDMEVMEHFHQLLSISESEQPVATEDVPLKSFPDHCDIKGGDDFVIHADQSLAAGTYYVRFGVYGMCEAQGSGSEFLLGLRKIPAATQRGSHTIPVDVSKETGEIIGKFLFTYTDVFFDQLFDYVCNPPKESDRRRKSQHPKNSSGKSCGAPGNHQVHGQKFKNCPVEMPMLMYLCDAMAKMGDEHFFSALMKLGIIPEILKKGSEYCKDIALTAREHGHNELAEIIATSSSEQPCDCDMKTLTIGKLFDAVQAERSLMANSGSDCSSDCDSNSCTTGYNGDLDSDEKSLEGDEPSARENVKDNYLHTENGDLHTENDDLHTENGDLHIENGYLHTDDGDLHTENGDLHTKSGDLHTVDGDLHTENGDLHTENGDLHTENGDLHTDDDDLHTENGDLRSENGDLHTENGEMLTENGHLPTETSDLHTGNSYLHNGNSALHTVNSDLHTDDGVLHTEYSALHTQNSNQHIESDVFHIKNYYLQTENCDLHTENNDLHTENGDLHTENSVRHTENDVRHTEIGVGLAEIRVLLAENSHLHSANGVLHTKNDDKQTMNGNGEDVSIGIIGCNPPSENKKILGIEESWKDEVRNKLAEVFKDKAEDLLRVLFFLDEEDKAYKDNVARPYAPQWKSLKVTLKIDKAFRAFAKRLSDETRRPERDQEFRKRMNIVEKMFSHNDTVAIKEYQKLDPNRLMILLGSLTSVFLGLARAWSTISIKSKVSVMVLLTSSSVITAVDDVVNVTSKGAGTIAMVSLAAVHLTYKAYDNIRRWWKGEISGKRCIKKLLDSVLTVAAGVAGGVVGAAIGSAVGGPFGHVVGGMVGGWVSATRMQYLSDVMTREMFGLPKEEALENAYRYLGVEITDPNAKVNTAFHQLCLEYHPDKGGSQDDFLILQCNMGIIKQAREDF